MRLTTKGRYGMRLVLDIAQHEGKGPVSINEISQRQGVSAKYLERLVGDLRRAGFVRSQRGRDGGHLLALPPESITVGAIVRALEGESFLLACCKNRHTCARSGSCLTRAIWIAADQAMYEKLNSVSVRHILDDARQCLAARDAASVMEAAFVPPRGNLRGRDAGDICPAPPYSVGPGTAGEAGKLCAAPAGPKAAATPGVPVSTMAPATAPAPATSPAAALHVAAFPPVAGAPARTRRMMSRRLFSRRIVASEVGTSEVAASEMGIPEVVAGEVAADEVAHVPGVAPASDVETGPDSPLNAEAQPTQHMLKVLLVEADEESLAEHLEGLRQAGYEACGAVDGPSALALLPDERPDLVAVDLQLPDSWGPRLCGELAREGARTAPVLILSAVPDMHLALRGAVGTIPRDAGALELLRAVGLALAPK